MNAKSKTPNAARTTQVLVATAGCLMMIACVSPEAFKVPLEADRSAAPSDGGADSKTSGGGGSFVAAGGTGGANLAGGGAGSGGRADDGKGGGGQAGSMSGTAGQTGGGTGG